MKKILLTQEDYLLSFDESINVLTKSKKECMLLLPRVIDLIIRSFEEEGTLLVCGNGGSACDALHFVAELVNRFQKERKGLSAISLNADIANLTSIANDRSYAQVFSRQIEAIGNQKDLLVLFSTSGNSENLVEAVKAAHQKEMPILFLSGQSGGKVQSLCEQYPSETFLHLAVPSLSIPRIQEVHGLLIHILCQALDAYFS